MRWIGNEGDRFKVAALLQNGLASSYLGIEDACRTA